MPKPLWVCVALFALTSIAIGAFVKSRNSHLPVPDIKEIQSIEANYYDSNKQERVTFQVPADHWQPILSSMLPARRDSDPAKWVSLGELQIKLAGGDSFLVSLYSVSDGQGAFSSGSTWEQRTYYRGGSSADLELALIAADKASAKSR